MKNWKQLLGVGAMLLTALAWSPAAQAQDNSVDAVKKRGQLQVGFGSFVPWAMRDKQGQWVGFEIDVATKLAKDMGVQVDRRQHAGVVEHGTGHALQPRRLTVLGEQHEPAAGHGDHRPRDDQSAQVIPADSFGSSLGTGEDVVLRGCELGHNAQGVDRHGIHLGGYPRHPDAQMRSGA